MLLDLDPGSPGEWLAGVGLAQFHPGRWVPDAEPLHKWTSWRYETDRIPTSDEIAEVLGACDSVGSRWLNHRGRGTPAATRKALLSAIAHTGGDVEIGPSEPRINAAAGWEIDAAWQAPPKAYDRQDPGRPLYTAALAWIGAHRASAWPGHWPRPSVAVGHLWTDDVEHHDPTGHVVVWIRTAAPGVPTAGPLGRHRVVQLGASWEDQVRVSVGLLPTLPDPQGVDSIEPVGLAEIAGRLGVQRVTVDQWRTRDLMPEPRWTVGGRPAWDWRTIEAWAALTDRLP